MIILLFKSAEWPLCLLLCVAWLCLKCRSALFCSHKDDQDRRRTSAFCVNVFAYQLLLSVKMG
uniref:Secreted protein n=1 Tax=Anguilla anguilla TaxID=7936 RepID=A0A0E9VA64_ANGAN